MPNPPHYPSGTVALLAGTKRGLFLLTSQDRKTWQVEEPLLSGRRIFNAVFDQRRGRRLFAAENDDFFWLLCALQRRFRRDLAGA